MKLSAGQAAKEIGKSVPTITRAIKSGKLSATPREGGGWDIDPSELHRVWPKGNGVTVTQPVTTERILGHETPYETSLLQVKLDAKDELLERMREELADMKQQRDKWQDQAQKLLLANHKEQVTEATQKPTGWLGRLLGGGR